MRECCMSKKCEKDGVDLSLHVLLVLNMSKCLVNDPKVYCTVLIYMQCKQN